ncbi:hypothetical protein IIE_05315 [Bacillus cereus VD045]|nr:hypothetical protein IIE_05315 [Bacillus cereus VD045]
MLILQERAYLLILLKSRIFSTTTTKTKYERAEKIKATFDNIKHVPNQ